MIAYASSEEAFKRTLPPRPKQPNSNAVRLSHTDFFGTYPEPSDGPQAFMVEIEGEILPHFHRVDQFQIFVRGSGTIGKHKLEPVAVHYVDRYTPYGPIRADDSVAFFTLRALNDSGAFYMPGSEKTVRSGRSFTVPAGISPGGASKDTGLTGCLEQQADGLAAFTVHVAPGTAAELPPSSGGGQYHLVAEGSCSYGGEELP